MVTQSQSESRNVGSGSLRELLSSRPFARSLVALGCFEAAYYLAYRYGMSFSQTTSSPFWFPDSVLLCALLRTRPRWWLLLLVGTLPIRFFSDVAAEVPLGMLISTAANDSLKAIIVAGLLRTLMPDPVRFQTVRDFGVYCLIAVLAAPAVSAIGGAAARGEWGAAYWTDVERWFLGDALTQLMVTPFIFYWVFRPALQRQLSAAQWLEALVLLAGLIVSLSIAFQPAANHLGFADSRLYAPVA